MVIDVDFEWEAMKFVDKHNDYIIITSRMMINTWIKREDNCGALW